MIVCLLAALNPVHAAPSVEIHATCAAELARDPAHLRTLRAELAAALDNVRLASGTSLDVSLVRVAARASGSGLEVVAEARALLSDKHGRVSRSLSARAVARGSVRDLALLQRDAVTAVARDLARAVRARAARG